MTTTRTPKLPTAKPKPAKAPRSSRVEARLTADQKYLVERAAAYEGQSIEDFISQAIAATAMSVVQDHEVIRLNQEQSLQVMERLLNPPEPTPALKQAAKKFLRTVEMR